MTTEQLIEYEENASRNWNINDVFMTLAPDLGPEQSIDSIMTIYNLSREEVLEILILMQSIPSEKRNYK